VVVLNAQKYRNIAVVSFSSLKFCQQFGIAEYANTVVGTQQNNWRLVQVAMERAENFGLARNGGHDQSDYPSDLEALWPEGAKATTLASRVCRSAKRRGVFSRHSVCGACEFLGDAARRIARRGPGMKR
jgi:hypothetical protein